MSVVIAIAGTACLVIAGRSFGALAFGGANLLAMLMWLAAHERMARLCRMQTARQAAVSWVGGCVWAAAVVALYRFDYRLGATLLLCVVLLLYTLSAWLLASGRLDEEFTGSGTDRGGGEG